MVIVPFFFAVTLLIDILMRRPGLQAWLLWVLFALCFSVAVVALRIGTRFPHAAGFSGMLVFGAASLYFMSAWADVQSAVSTAQELPLLALYLGWFVPKPLGRIVMSSFTVLLIVVMVLNPIFRPGGELDAPVVVQMILVSLFCFELGSVLWRRSMRKITTDELTGVLNRVGFMEALDRELARPTRSEHPMCLVVIDFDRFKELNDTQGHGRGDQALIETVAGWRAALRTGDVIGRTGGDEFAILLDRTDPAGAQQIMARLREDSPHPWSWGISQARFGDTNESIFSRADERLYSFKIRPGRGRA